MAEKIKLWIIYAMLGIFFVGNMFVMTPNPITPIPALLVAILIVTEKRKREKIIGSIFIILSLISLYIGATFDNNAVMRKAIEVKSQQNNGVTQQ